MKFKVHIVFGDIIVSCLPFPTFFSFRLRVVNHAGLIRGGWIVDASVIKKGKGRYRRERTMRSYDLIFIRESKPKSLKPQSIDAVKTFDSQMKCMAGLFLHLSCSFYSKYSNTNAKFTNRVF